jgi:hypothetical protein
VLWDRIFSLSPFELLGAALSIPLFSLALASIVLASLGLVRRARRSAAKQTQRTRAGASSAAAQYELERRVLGIGAVGVIVAFAIEYVVRGYLLNISDTVDWWRYATPVLASLVTLAVLLGFIVFRGTVTPERPAVSATRRTWSSFGPRRAIIGTSCLAIVFLATTIAAGMASSPDDRGRFIYLEIPAPNTSIDPLRPWFYGWAYGVPVIACVAALIVVTWVTLRSNAGRPFLRPETIPGEQRARVEIATSAVHIAASGMLLALGGVFRFISRSGSYSTLTIGGDGQNDSYELSWRYASLAVAAGWISPIMEITAFVLLLLVARRSLRSRPDTQPIHNREQNSISEAVR